MVARGLQGRKGRPFVARTSTQQVGRACPLCPGTSGVNLLRYRERVINLNAQISDGALDLCVAGQELDGPKIACAPIDQRRLRPPEGMGPKSLGSSPVPAIHSETSRAYWRVVMANGGCQRNAPAKIRLIR